MRVCLISDTHERHSEVELPPADLLIHSGDFTQRGEMTAVIDFNNWLGENKHKYKYGVVCVCGNHERKLDPENKDFLEGLDRLLTNARLLCEQSITINGYTIYGSPYSPDFSSNWAYVYDRAEGFKHWDKIPDNTDILITHCPAEDILDKSSKYGSGLGCHDLKLAVQRVKPSLHVHGHIHGSHGTLYSYKQKTLHVNAAICGEPKWEDGKRMYEVKNKPVVVDLAPAWVLHMYRKVQRQISKLDRLDWHIANRMVKPL